MNLRNKNLIKDFGYDSFVLSGGMQGGGGVAEDLLTTKGDTHGYTTENARVAIGADGQILTADSTVPLGLGWAAAAAGGLTEPEVNAIIGENKVKQWVWRTPPASNWSKVEWSPKLSIFAAVGSGAIMTSGDGINWTSRTAPAGNSWQDVVWSPELEIFCGVSSTGSFEAMTSPDGITWTLRTAAANNEWQSVEWSPELALFCAVSYNGSLSNKIMTSPDGITWTARTSPTSDNWLCVKWSPDLLLFCATGYKDVAGTYSNIMTSPDGITWTRRISPTDANNKGLVWSPELFNFVIVSTQGTNRVITTV